MTVRLETVCIDTHDPDAIATFWQAVLGWIKIPEEPDDVVLEPPPGSPEDGIAPVLLFQKVRESKTVKNRLHFDLRPDDQAAEVERIEKLGGRRISIGQGDVTWVVMADPDGNEFCVLRALTPEELAAP